MNVYRPVALIILDGWGIREMTHGNAVVQANTPNYDSWLRNLERSILDASEEAVGLPAGQMGNSEVGHLNLGAGHIVYQDISRIDRAISEGTMDESVVLQSRFESLKQSGANLHLIGLLGTGGVHSHIRHLHALLDLLNRRGVKPLLHLITDGRDTPPNSAQEFVRDLEIHLDTQNVGTIATVSGRYYAMDRDKRWERTKLAYDAMTSRQGPVAESASAAITQAYASGKTDEFIPPTVIGPVDDTDRRIKSGDILLFFNFRADRMRQLVKMFANYELDGFRPEDDTTYVPIEPLTLLTLTQYQEDLPVDIIFGKQNVTNPLAKVISEHGLRQFHTAETEKYAHVTYFFNGGREEPFPGEEHMLIQSPKVATYDLQPEMSAYELRDAIVPKLKNQETDFVCLNFANPDMVGHTGVLQAAIDAVSATDECAGRIVKAVNDKGGIAIVTADHGNAERMIDEVTGGPHTYHTTNPVSLFVIGDGYHSLRPRGILADVAPTVLHLLGLPKPEEMTRQSLINGE